MRIFRQYMILEKADDNKGAGGAGSPPAQPVEGAAKPEPKAGEQPKPAEGAPKVEGEGSPLDFYSTQEPKEGDKKANPPASRDKQEKAEPTKVEDPATGYGDKPPAVEEPPPAPAPVEKIELGFEVDTKDLPEDRVKSLLEDVKELGLDKEKAQKYIDKAKTSVRLENEAKAKAEKETNRIKQQTRVEWHNELLSDPVFGGENFASNIQQAERVLQEFMPNTKKRLTETKSMLPPYVMRDLAKLADHVYATEKSVHGNPPTPPVEETESSPLDFYNKPQAG